MNTLRSRVIASLAERNCKTAFETLDEACPDDADAQYVLGLLSLRGICARQSAAVAHEQFTYAAARGHAFAMMTLALLYADGEGVPVDTARTVELCESAAAVGAPQALTRLGSMYDKGEFAFPEAPDRAADYYHRAVEAGDAHALVLLGVLYLDGRGVRRDIEYGSALIRSSADAGDPDGLSILGDLYYRGTYGHPRDTATSSILLRKAARLGDAYARNALKRFPPVLPTSQPIGCSSGASALSISVRREVIARHHAGDWGEVTPEEWDRNDSCVREGRDVRSTHLSLGVTIVMVTPSDRRSSWIELLDEPFEGASRTAAELLEAGAWRYEIFLLSRDLQHG